jgi:WD40 repeat protein
MFDLMVSGDEEAVVCVWKVADGNRVVRFSECHPANKITAMCFDSSERRLITGANDGSVRMWNFNNGALLKEFFHKDEPEEVEARRPIWR